MGELCRLRRSEGYGARDDEEQDKSVPPCWRPADHFCPQCGQFTGDGSGVTSREENTN